MYSNKIVNKERKRAYINNLLKTQPYFKIKSRNVNFLLAIIVLFVCIFLFDFKYNKMIILSEISEVNIKVKGNGNIKLVSDSFFEKYSHCDIFLNGENNSDINVLNLDQQTSQSINDIKIIWYDTIITTEKMFEDCGKIVEIDLSKFDSSLVNNMNNMFYYCYSLTSINLLNFDTSKVKNMKQMFTHCSSLKSLNLSNFNTSLVNDMTKMFFNCTSLNELNLSNFDTSEVKYMNYMFYKCEKLQFLDLSHFDTSNVETMNYMFEQILLTSLDLHSFNTSHVIDMRGLFHRCPNLVSLDQILIHQM